MPSAGVALVDVLPCRASVLGFPRDKTLEVASLKFNEDSGVEYLGEHRYTVVEGDLKESALGLSVPKCRQSSLQSPAKCRLP